MRYPNTAIYTAGSDNTKSFFPSLNKTDENAWPGQVRRRWRFSIIIPYALDPHAV